MTNLVLIVEDDFDLAKNLVDFLEIKGYSTDHAADFATAVHLIGTVGYDLVILDLGLPGGSGVDLCRLIRQGLSQSTPVVMLTAQDDLDIKLDSFNMGADDYIIKPAALKEIEARIRALIRRSHREFESGVYEVGDLRMEIGIMRVTRGGVPIVLPALPMRILRTLMAHAPNVVSHTKLRQDIWGDEAQDSHVLIAHMHTLRNAVDRPFEYPLIHTIRGFGYRIADDFQ